MRLPREFQNEPGGTTVFAVKTVHITCYRQHPKVTDVRPLWRIVDRQFEKGRLTWCHGDEVGLQLTVKGQQSVQGALFIPQP